jgi:mevalonate pyrophosphate decarboxylase
MHRDHIGCVHCGLRLPQSQLANHLKAGSASASRAAKHDAAIHRHPNSAGHSEANIPKLIGHVTRKRRRVS